MTLSSLMSVLWRQRLFVIPAVWVAVLLCVAVVAIAPPTYRASGSVVLLNPPALPQTQIGGPDLPANWQNPYARIGNLSVVVDLMVRVLRSDAVEADLKAAGFRGTEDVAGSTDFSGSPIVDLAAEADSAEQAMANVHLLLTEFSEQLQLLQDQQGTAREYHIRAETVISPDKATTVFSGTLRILLVTMFIGAGMVVGVGLLADRLRSPKPAPTRAKPSVDRAGPDAAEASDPEEEEQVGQRSAAGVRAARPRCGTHRLFLKADGTCSRCLAEAETSPATASAADAADEVPAPTSDETAAEAPVPANGSHANGRHNGAATSLNGHRATNGDVVHQPHTSAAVPTPPERV